MHPKIRKAIGKASEFINRPMVRGVSKFSGSLLQTMHLMKERSPLSVAVAGFSIVNSLADSFDLPQLSPLESYIKANNLVADVGMLPKLVYLSEYYKHCDKQTVFSSEDEDLIEIEIEGAGKFYIIEFTAQALNLSPRGRSQKVAEDFFFTEGFAFEKLFDKVWDHYSSGIFLKRHRHSFDLELTAVPDEEPIYIGEHDLEDFYSKLKRAIDKDISRSFLLEGPPGTGKTSLALKIARTYFRRTVKLDPHVTRSFESGELEFFVSQLRPEVIIFEDFDRAFSFADVALSMLENLKKSFPRLVIFGTVNDMSKLDSALLRPGRFDKILHVGYPAQAHRKKILRLYFNKYGVEMSDSLISVIAEHSSRLTPIYLKELAIESRNLDPNNMIEEISELIEEYNQRISRAEDIPDEPEMEEEVLTAELLEEVSGGISPEELDELDLLIQQ